MSDPTVSCVVMNWNGRQLLEECLSSIYQSDYKSLEVLVADCGSTDGSADFVSSHFPLAKVVRFETDPGPDYANNYCVGLAKGSFIILMNNDIVVPQTTISSLVNSIRSTDGEPIAAREHDRGGRLWSKGVAYHWLMPIYILLKPLYSRRILSISTGGPFYVGIVCTIVSKEKMIRYPLNEHLRAFEEMEWCWRFHLAGLNVKVDKQATVLHKGSATMGASTKPAFYSGRTMIATHYVCAGNGLLFFIPILTSYYATKTLVYILTRRIEHAKAFVQGFASFFHDLSFFKADRREVQGSRQVSDRYILRRMIESCHYLYGEMSMTLMMKSYIRKNFLTLQ